MWSQANHRLQWNHVSLSGSHLCTSFQYKSSGNHVQLLQTAAFPHLSRIDCTRGLIMFWFWVVRIFVLSATMPLSCRCVLGRVLSFRYTYSAFEPSIAKSQLIFFPHILVTIHKHSWCSYVFHWLVCSCTNERITFVCHSLVVFRSW